MVSRLGQVCKGLNGKKSCKFEVSVACWIRTCRAVLVEGLFSLANSGNLASRHVGSELFYIRSTVLGLSVRLLLVSAFGTLHKSLASGHAREALHA